MEFYHPDQSHRSEGLGCGGGFTQKPNACVPADQPRQFCLFKPLIYQAQSPIPLSIHITGSTPVLADLMLACAQATLIKRTTVTVRDQTYSNEEVLGTSVFGKAESKAEGDGRITRAATGCLSGGRDQGEIAWQVNNMIKVEVSYT